MAKYGKYNNKAYPLRINEELKEKAKIIASKEQRKLNQQIEYIIKQYVDEYEEKNGQITIKDINNIDIC